MGFRTVVVNSRAKLEFRLNFMIVRCEKERRIYIDEINTLIIQSTAVAITSALLAELVKRNVKIIFCDEEVVELYKHCSMQQVSLLLVENSKNRNRLNTERRIIITEDLCELTEGFDENELEFY